MGSESGELSEMVRSSYILFDLIEGRGGVAIRRYCYCRVSFVLWNWMETKAMRREEARPPAFPESESDSGR